MLTRLRIQNFKLFDNAEIELGNTVVLIGPNNSGKTSALQALALWNIGLKKWNEKRQGKASPEKRPGVTINRRDLFSIPVPNANLLWNDLHVREVERVRNGTEERKKTKTSNVRIEIEVEGVSHGKSWKCGFEFDYGNPESFYCRPLRTANNAWSDRSPVPEEAHLNVAFLPPMSGLTAAEPKWEPGRIDVLVGEGQTAQVLRNLCFQIHSDSANATNWQHVVTTMERLFGVQLLPPEYVAERGEIEMSYKESGTLLDLSCAGRGLQQTLLLLAYLYAKPGTVLLLDEPDAHLEILRQRQTYTLLTDTAEQLGSQIIAASHSEVVLNEACERDTVIAFVGKPHRIDDRGSNVRKALRDIGFDQYYQAEQMGWVLYLEGPSDLAILQAFARTLEHDAAEFLERPFVHYVASNRPQRAREHFYGLREAKSDLAGVAIFDRLEKELQASGALVETMWSKSEIENYLCRQDVLMAYASQVQQDDLFGLVERERRQTAMAESIEDVTKALRILNKNPWSDDIKASEEVLDNIFREFSKKLGLPLELRKSDYHGLAEFIERPMVDPEIVEKLDTIVSVARRAGQHRG